MSGEKKEKERGIVLVLSCPWRFAQFMYKFSITTNNIWSREYLKIIIFINLRIIININLSSFILYLEICLSLLLYVFCAIVVMSVFIYYYFTNKGNIFDDDGSLPSTKA